MEQRKKGVVILLHGLYMSDKIMMPMAKRLSKLGWDSRCINYCTTKINEDEVFTQISNNLPKKNDTPVHFIGHSLGGLMIRHYYNVCNPSFPGRVVTMGTPHQTANISRLLKKFNAEKIIGNSSAYGISEKLNPNKWIYKNELGNIAGNLRLGIQLINPGVSKIVNDGTVLEPETHLNGEKDHITLCASHTSLVYSRIALRQADYFLLNGDFVK